MIRSRGAKRLASRKLLGIALSVLALAAACGSDDGGDAGDAGDQASGATTESTAAAEEPTPGGTLRFYWGWDASSMDPAKTSFGSGMGGAGFKLAAIYDALFYVDQETSEVVPKLAVSLESPDGDAVVWELKLRPDVTFTDGTPLDAEAVRFNWQRIADPATASPLQQSAAEIQEMEVVDPTTLRITLTAPNGQFPQVVARNLTFIGSPAAMQELGDDFGNHPVGAGPFVLESFVQNQEATFVRNDDYWDAPRPYLDRFELLIVRDDEQRLNAVVTGQAELANVIGFPQVVRGRSEDIALHEPSGISGGYTVVFNTASGPFQDVRLRRAIQLAWDHDVMNATVALNAATRVDSPFAEGSPFYDASITYPEADMAEAQRLIDEVAEAEGGPVHINLVFSSGQQDMAEFIQAQLLELDDIDLELVPLTSPESIARKAEGNFDMSFAAAQYLDPEPVLYQTLLTGSPQNVMRYSNPEVDAALETGHTSLDLDERIEAYRVVQEHMISDMPLMFYAARVNYHFASKDLRGVELVNDSYPFIDRLWLDQG